MFVRILLLFCLAGYGTVHAREQAANYEKVLICGICKNAAYAVENTIQNIEALGSHFQDYAVIIYENNSLDDTAARYGAWAKKNPKVLFLSESVKAKKLPSSRTECIARARNIVLKAARNPKYKRYKYLIMADLDFMHPWPIQEILSTLEVPIDWDCVAANGIFADGLYYDRYAFRDQNFPFGPENMGDRYWDDLPKCLFKLSGEDWIPVYSAFGGLAIYKKDALLKCKYSGVVTNDLKTRCTQILQDLPPKNPQLTAYLETLGLASNTPKHSIPILFQKNTFGEHPADYKPVTCCEHVPLHASMALKGHKKIYINPKMILKYH